MYIAHICTSCSKLTMYTIIVSSLGVDFLTSGKGQVDEAAVCFRWRMLRTRSNCYELWPSIVVHGWRSCHILWCLACQFFPQQNGGLRQSKASGWVQQVPGCGSSGISRHEVQEQVYGIFQQRFDMKVPKKVPSRGNVRERSAWVRPQKYMYIYIYMFGITWASLVKSGWRGACLWSLGLCGSLNRIQSMSEMGTYNDLQRYQVPKKRCTMFMHFEWRSAGWYRFAPEVARSGNSGCHCMRNSFFLQRQYLDCLNDVFVGYGGVLLPWVKLFFLFIVFWIQSFPATSTQGLLPTKIDARSEPARGNVLGWNPVLTHESRLLLQWRCMDKSLSRELKWNRW